LAQKIRLQDLTTIVLQNTQLLNAYEKTEQAESKADNLYQFQQALTDFLEREIALEIETPLDILGRFLSEYLLDDLSDQQADDNSLVMSTCHAAKGLEWPYVIIIGAEDQFFPHEQSSSYKEIEEERRLMYVSITRAKKQLFLTQARQRQRYQDLIFPSLSRFLEPIGSDLLIITRSASSGAGAVPINQKRPTVVQKPLRQLLMDHPLFGTGIVEWSSQEHNLLKVRFPKDGLKTLRYSLCEPFLRSE
jgi:DNA helicase-2/ATP-dependent DNA helicase PcrA